jgi:hypothetical protein
MDHHVVTGEDRRCVAGVGVSVSAQRVDRSRARPNPREMSGPYGLPSHVSPYVHHVPDIYELLQALDELVGAAA